MRRCCANCAAATLANAFRIEQRLTGRTPGSYIASVLANPRWVRAVRDGWKRFYRGLLGVR